MDNFTMKEVERIVNDGLLSAEILHSIFESTTRKIEMYNDVESINILKYLEGENSIPEEVRFEIRDFLYNYDKYKSSLVSNDDVSNSSYVFYIITGVILIVVGVFLVFAND